MNLIEAFNILTSAARSIQASGADHDKIKEALSIVSIVVKDRVELDQQKENKE